MNEIHYKNNFLQEVIIKIDFSPPVILFEKQLAEELLNVITRYYPLYEPMKEVSNEISFINDQVSSNKNIFPKHVFFGSFRERHVVITKNAILFSFKKYESFNDVRKMCFDLLDKINQLDTNIIVARIGMRYINVIRNHQNRYNFVVKNFNPVISYPFKSKIHQDLLVRNMNIIEYKTQEDLNLRIQSGLFNPDYPSLLRNKDFLLDLDGYTSNLFDFSVANNTIIKLHELIQKNFENLITNNMRNLLNE